MWPARRKATRHLVEVVRDPWPEPRAEGAAWDEARPRAAACRHVQVHGGSWPGPPAENAHTGATHKRDKDKTRKGHSQSVGAASQGPPFPI